MPLVQLRGGSVDQTKRAIGDEEGNPQKAHQLALEGKLATKNPEGFLQGRTRVMGAS